jgi:hypothetical protein
MQVTNFEFVDITKWRDIFLESEKSKFVTYINYNCGIVF